MSDNHYVSSVSEILSFICFWLRSYICACHCVEGKDGNRHRGGVSCFVQDNTRTMLKRVRAANPNGCVHNYRIRKGLKVSEKAF